jgi:hypothetical protein
MYVTFGDYDKKMDATCQVLGMIAVTMGASLTLDGKLRTG